MNQETQKSVANWAEQTFGPVADHSKLVERAQIELAELLEATQDGDKAEMAKETADVFILLMRLAELNNFDIQEAINNKMQENRNRKWLPSRNGTGKHLP